MGPVEIRHLGPHSARRPAIARQLRPHVPRRHPAAGLRSASSRPRRSTTTRRRAARSCRISIPTAHADDPRPGRPSADVHRRRPETPPVGDAAAFHRVRRQSVVAPRQDGAGDARHDQQRRMDRRAVVDAAQGVRPERQRHVVRRRGRGRSQRRIEHAGRQGHGRLHDRLRHERRGGAAAKRLPAAPDGPGLRGDLPHQVAAAHQARRSLLHELQRLRPSASGRTRRRHSAIRSDRSR